MLGNFVHQILACGETLAVSAQFQGVGTEVVGDVAECIIRVIGHQAVEAVLSAEANHFLMVVLKALCDLHTENKGMPSDAGSHCSSRLNRHMDLTALKSY